MITQSLLNQIRHIIKPIQTRLANSIARAVVQNVSDATKMQMLQLGVLDGETVDDCERFQEYGFNSVPPNGAEAVVVFPNGDRGHPLVVAVDDRRYRPTDWVSGEAGIYSKFLNQVRLMADGTIEASAGGVAVALATKADIDALITTFNAHIHGGVTTGAGVSAVPGTPAASSVGTTKLKGE